ncbi:TMV resistance protein N isoform X2 [Vigna radiata var. radiata]|uniref:TMV resistance protein N isoform X2 n=1 Tax=Vigna radiata var. radiata TaxID=3916 RepID=A0A3Q0EKV9_VIGRR|nr:TMV resistance protein N isoform X2 [Vigna radiata var. radiata]
MDFVSDRYQKIDGGNFEVFLSFKGEDTRASFTSHLYTALQNAGIFVFKDDESLPQGKQISRSLRQAIEESRISIVVFSKNYAESWWCLKELEIIMECHKTTGNVVLPVFYDIYPSEVRHQKGDFGEAFQRLLSKFSKEEEQKVLDWKHCWWNTLREICNISAVEILSPRIERVDKLDNQWEKTLLEVVQISKILDLNPRGKMKIADSIEILVRQSKEGLFKGAEISFREEKVYDKMDFLMKQWREVFCEPFRNSEVALDPCFLVLHVKHFRETLFEAADISGDLVLNSCGEMEITYAIELHMKHWRNAFSEEAGTILDSIYIRYLRDKSVVGMVHSEIRNLRDHWREKVCEAYDRSGDNQLYSRRKNDIELHLENCTKALLEATDISKRAVFVSSYKKLKAYNRIESLVKYWKIALCEAVEISRLVVEHYRGITDNEVNYIEKHARDALREAAGLPGNVILNFRNESEAVKNIVKDVTRLLDKTELFVPNNPVGVESRVQEMVQLLEQKQSNDVLLLGIWGMGGIGKTTIAKAIYNKIGRNFEGRSFLADIREVWGQEAGHVSLQQQLLSDVYKENRIKIHNIESGKVILRERLRRKRILLILDDVNKLQQLNALCGNREWFGAGSRIIITTRDIHLLRGKRVDQVFTMTGMNVDESIELFSWHAFKQASPKEDFIELSRNVVAYAGGLPLALEVLGSYLFDMEVTEWKSVLEKLRKIPNDEVQEKLKISYDGLSDDTEKGIFLDIACFFIGKDRNDVIHILNGCGLFAENGIRVLVERSLVTVDDKNQLGMHDLLRDMGREIIRSKSPMELEERSRLWFHEDVLDVLSKETGTKFIEGLTLKLPRSNTKSLSTKAFMNMKKLRLLQLSGVELVGDFEYLSKDLRWLCWHGFPFASIPTSFYQGSLVSIELENSKITMVWKATQLMEKLKILNLSHSHYLTKTPDFLNLPNLEKLILVDCPRLSEVSYTIGHLTKVLLINFQDCISLCNLPRSIYKLKSLKTLILSGCLKIDKLEEDLEEMESLTTLFADKTAIRRVPFSIVRSKSIGYISLCGYEGFSRDVFPSIIWSWMSPVNSLSSRVQTLVDMSSLVFLDVQNSSSNQLSYISEELPKLQSLWIECGSDLQLSRYTKIILDALNATNSEESESYGTTSQMQNVFTLIECSSRSKLFEKTLLIQMGGSWEITHILKQRILQNMTTSDGGDCLLPGDSYPDWLSFSSEGSSVTFEIPEVNGRSLKTMMCHIHYSSPDSITSDGLKNLLVINHTKSTIQLYKRNALAAFDDEEWQRVLSNIDTGNQVQIVVVFWSRITVKKTSIYLIYEAIDEKVEHYHASNMNVPVSISPEVESMEDLRGAFVKSLTKFLSCCFGT